MVAVSPLKGLVLMDVWVQVPPRALMEPLSGAVRYSTVLSPNPA